MGTKKKINGVQSSATSFRYSPDYNHNSVNSFHERSGGLRTRTPDYNYYRNQRSDREHLGGVGSNIRLYNSCQTLMVTSPSPPPRQNYVVSKNQENLRHRQYSSNGSYEPYNRHSAVAGFSTSSSFISAPAFAPDGNVPLIHKQHQSVFKQSVQERSSGRRYICGNSVSTHQNTGRSHFQDHQRESSCDEDDYSVSGEDDCSTLCYDISADDIHEAPRLNGQSSHIGLQDPSLSSKVPSYSLWRHQVTTRQERTDNYPSPFGSSPSYYTSDSAKALVYEQGLNQDTYRFDNMVRESERNHKSEKTTIKRKTVSASISNPISGRPSLTRKSSHRKSMKRRVNATGGGIASKIPNDIGVPIKSSLKKQSSDGIETGNLVTQKVSMALVTRQVSIRRRKSIRRKKSSSSKRQHGLVNNRGQLCSSKDLDSIDERHNEQHAVINTKRSNTSSTLKSCRSMSEFETLPAKYHEGSKGKNMTTKLSSILTNGSNSKGSSKSRRSKPKMLDEKYHENHTENGLFINKGMFNRDKEYEELCTSKNDSSSGKHNKKLNSVKSQKDGHGKVCCGGTACCNER